MAGHICDRPSDYFQKLQASLRRVDQGALESVVQMLENAWRAGSRVFIFGNGGSASTAGHLVCDLLKNAGCPGKPRLAVFGLMDNLALFSAISNDLGYDQVFQIPLSTYARAGDLAIAISASGNSHNVLQACEWAQSNGLHVVALTGFQGGKLGELAHLHMNVPSENYGIIEDVHLSIGHAASQMLRSRIERDCSAPDPAPNASPIGP